MTLQNKCIEMFNIITYSAFQKDNKTFVENFVNTIPNTEITNIIKFLNLEKGEKFFDDLRENMNGFFFEIQEYNVSINENFNILQKICQEMTTEKSDKLKREASFKYPLVSPSP